MVLEFAIAVFRGVFRPAQMAALLVRCYPAVPDALGIASALAAELGEPDSPATQQLTMQLGGYAVRKFSGLSIFLCMMVFVIPGVFCWGSRTGSLRRAARGVSGVTVKSYMVELGEGWLFSRPCFFLTALYFGSLRAALCGWILDTGIASSVLGSGTHARRLPGSATWWESEQYIRATVAHQPHLHLR